MPANRHYFLSQSRGILLIALLVLGATGCQSWLNRENTKETVQGVSVLHSSGAEQFSYIKQHKSMVRFCTETDTDVEGTSSGGLTLSAAGDSIGDASSSGAVTLGGRDPTVLITRELMFRACELALNTNLKPRDARKVYMGTLNVLIDIIKVHKGSGTKSISVAAAKSDIPMPAKPSSSAQKQTGVNTSNSSINSDFSGFTWDDYDDDANTIDDAHP